MDSSLPNFFPIDAAADFEIVLYRLLPDIFEVALIRSSIVFAAAEVPSVDVSEEVLEDVSDADVPEKSNTAAIPAFGRVVPEDASVLSPPAPKASAAASPNAKNCVFLCPM